MMVLPSILLWLTIKGRPVCNITKVACLGGVDMRQKQSNQVCNHQYLDLVTE